MTNKQLKEYIAMGIITHRRMVIARKIYNV